MNTYTFESYNSAAPVTPAAGMRLSKVLYRSDNAEAKENSYISIPVISDAEVTEQMTVLLPHLVSYLQDQQDSIVKKAHTGGFSSVTLDQICLTAVIDLLESTGQGRLNKEVIFAWYDADVADALMVAFADKLGLSDTPTDEESEKVAVIVATYRKNFGALAGGRSMFMPDTASAMQRALEVTGANHTALGARFVKRLEDMINPPTNLLESL